MTMTAEKIQKKYEKFMSNLLGLAMCKSELDILRCLAGNYIEAAQRNYSKIYALDIPQQHKEIAYEILREELAIIHSEFRKAYEEL